MFKRIQMFKKGVTRPQGVGRGKAAILAGKGVPLNACVFIIMSQLDSVAIARTVGLFLPCPELIFYCFTVVVYIPCSR